MPTGLPVAADLVWFKSSHSGGNATECLECAYAPTRTLIRDSKRANGPVLSVSPGAWRHFVDALHPAGEHGLAPHP
ncbi:hypothetical protein SAM23877_2917 [Streptomyces ambofaciens ATCC 23877]|uniref:DUF397 domain-containing protein n=1 Tax=Streptomyces ambofaciens (strain ATCC 23877 / 3486 / DSM 40053 / JCM 4204 / NBRC 12836 / NRRL B-2516) TaxID=278992 RepID=A0A0K2ASQ7_STRA7|nr:DUF397 domain-containing protein [Streptomyces ambofaciens]AKZ55966.1 hypothetical protein SAM23877_2917 [Streptomyces ambofaciens ATCC 23877]